VKLPYGGNDSMNMYVFVPKARDGLAAAEATLTAPGIDLMIAGISHSKAQVWLPRFGVKSSLSLGDTLKAMGMPSAFTYPDADFSGMDERVRSSSARSCTRPS